MMKQTDDIAKQ